MSSEASLKSTKEEEINHHLDALQCLLHSCNPPDSLMRDTYHCLNDLRVFLFLCVHDGKFVE